MLTNVPIVLGIAVATVIAVVLGIAAVVVYFKGARPGEPWGTPLLVLLVIGAVLAVFAERLDLGRRLSTGSSRRFQSAKLIGRGLKGKIDDGARVLIFRYPVATETMPEDMPPPPEGEGQVDMPTAEEQVAEMQANWKKAIESGAGVSIEIVACEVPETGMEMMMISPEMPGDARAFNAVLEKHKDEGIDAWISFVGVPRTMRGQWDLHNISSAKWDNPPLGAAELGVYYDPELVRKWFQDGFLDVATIHPSTKSPDMKVITKDNVDELPEEPPVQLGPPPGAQQER